MTENETPAPAATPELDAESLDRIVGGVVLHEITTTNQTDLTVRRAGEKPQD